MAKSIKPKAAPKTAKVPKKPKKAAKDNFSSSLELVVKKPKKSAAKKKEVFTEETRYKSISSSDFVSIIDQQLERSVYSTKGQANFNFVKQLFDDKNYEELFSLEDVESFVYRNLKDQIEKIGKDYFLIFGEQRIKIPNFSTSLRDLCLDIDSFKNLDYFKLFIKKLLQNESSERLSHFLGYLSSQKFIINQNGNIIAYKAVRPDYTDKHSGKFDNSVGTTVSMPRSKVDPNFHNTCSHGLHVGNLEYIKGYCNSNDVLLAVEIDPVNLVSVPGISEGKIRVCEYTVICRISWDTAIRKSKFLDTVEFISTCGLPDIGVPRKLSAKSEQKKLTSKTKGKKVKEIKGKIEQTVEGFVKWLTSKIAKSTTKSITWGQIIKSYKKEFPEMSSDSIKLYVMQFFSMEKDSKLAKSKIKLKLDSADYHC